MNIIPISEIIYDTIQGEGVNCGAFANFIRVMGCSYRCTWCDTKYAQDVTDSPLSMESVALANHFMENYPSTYRDLPIILTGGDPLHYDFSGFITRIREEYPTQQFWVETQGVFTPPWVFDVDYMAVSPKLPSSGMWDETQRDFPRFMEVFYKNDTALVNGEIKFVVADDDDLDAAVELLGYNEGLCWSVVFQPCALEGNSVEGLCNKTRILLENVRELELPYSVYVLPQLHRLLWGTARGV